MLTQVNRLLRSRPRFEAYLEARLDTGSAAGEATVLSLSEMGLFAATDLDLPPGTWLSMTFALPDMSQVRVDGVVIYQASRHGRDGYGLRFLSTRDSARSSRCIRRWYEENDVPVQRPLWEPPGDAARRMAC